MMPDGMPDDFQQRNPGTQHMVNMLSPNPNLPEGLPAEISAATFDMAISIARSLPDTPELTAGLRKLLEAKDCFVRAAVNIGPES